MKDAIDILSIILPVISALGGAYLGGFFTRRVQNDSLRFTIEREEFKERKNEINETLLIYNKLLEIDGSHLMITHIGGSQIEFEINTYLEKIRPHIYEKFHLIHKDVAELIKEIDKAIQYCNFNEEITWAEHEGIAKNYYKLIEKVEQHIENYRNRN
ncbi:hypothetical protein [Niallia circulans]|uniref:hypothetical protein n=1 Tax=Niallia circulans TaxID=1397 RepID=UPI00069CF389|nr:hypothetical protein [Niallia circulans]